MLIYYSHSTDNNSKEGDGPHVININTIQLFAKYSTHWQYVANFKLFINTHGFNIDVNMYPSQQYSKPSI